MWNGTTIKDLGSFGGDSQALSINNGGYAVGFSELGTGADPGAHAFIWHNTTGMVDLNSLLNQKPINDGWVLISANDINNNGWIIGIANNTITGTSSNFLLKPTFTALHTTISPIPEPSTYAMLLAGLGMLGFVARRRNCKQ